MLLILTFFFDFLKPATAANNHNPPTKSKNLHSQWNNEISDMLPAQSLSCSINWLLVKNTMTSVYFNNGSNTLWSHAYYALTVFTDTRRTEFLTNR